MKKVSYVPPKLPGTTNFVFTSSKKEYNEINAIATIVTAENSIPPLKNALPRNSTPVPTNDFNNYRQ